MAVAAAKGCEAAVMVAEQASGESVYWLRGQVLAPARHLALCHGIPLVERNPAWTGQACPYRSHLGERSSPGGRGYPSRFRCEHCGWTGEANIVAAVNLKRTWDRNFRYPTAKKKREAETGRRKRAGAVAGANVRTTTDAPRPDAVAG